MGHHAEPDAPQIETPYDPPPEGIGEPPSQTEATPPAPPADASPTDAEDVPPAAQTSTNTSESTDSHKGKLHKWWDWIADTFQEAKDKLKGMFGNEHGTQ